MDATPTSGQSRDLTRYCAAACDLNHAAIPHAFGDCNASLDAPTLTAEQRRVLPEAELPWVRYANRRAAAAPPYLLGSEHFTTAAAELRGWFHATLARQQQRAGCVRDEPAVAATLELDDRDRQHLQEQAASRRRAREAAQRWSGRGSGVGRER